MELSLNKKIGHTIRVQGDPVLTTRCKEVESFGPKTEKLAKTLLKALDEEDNGIGLAANQIGISLRAFAYDLRDVNPERHPGHENSEQMYGVIFNPVIESFSEELWSYDEGCLSIPHFFWPLDRPEKITVSGFTSAGEPLHFELDGLAARLFQHELDHLDGLLIFDRIDNKNEKAAAHKHAKEVLEMSASRLDKLKDKTKSLLT